MAGLSDILTSIQNGVTALNNLGSQVGGSFNNISGQITALSSQVTTNTAAIAALQTPACFSVNKNSSDQTGVADSTFTIVTWPTEVYDVGSHFASNAWTPPAGKIHLDACLLILGTFITGNQLALAIYKNGVQFAQNNNGASSAIGGGSVNMSMNDIANGTDAYQVLVFADTSSGTATVNGVPAGTYYSGFWVSS